MIILIFGYLRFIDVLALKRSFEDSVKDANVLKIHYAVVPKYMSFLSSACKICNERYNEIARDNFNKSKTPDSLSEKALSILINSSTKASSLFLDNICFIYYFFGHSPHIVGSISSNYIFINP